MFVLCSPTKLRSSMSLEKKRDARAKLLFYVSVKSKLQHAPPGIPRAFDTFAVPGRREFDDQSLPGGGEFELHPRFHVKSLAWWAIMGDAVLEDFRGKDCAFVANWLRGKGWSKLCAVFEGFKFWNFQLDSGFECILLLCLHWNTVPIPAIQYNNIK